MSNLLMNLTTAILSPKGLFGTNKDAVQDIMTESSDEYLITCEELSTGLSDFLGSIKYPLSAHGDENKEKTEIVADLDLGGPKSKLGIELLFTVDGLVTVVNSPVFTIHSTTLINNPFGGDWIQLIVKLEYNGLPQVLVFLRTFDHLRVDLFCRNNDGKSMLQGQHVLINNGEGDFTKGPDMTIEHLRFIAI
jgi:hypothetical protein